MQSGQRAERSAYQGIKTIGASGRGEQKGNKISITEDVDSRKGKKRRAGRPLKGMGRERREERTMLVRAFQGIDTRRAETKREPTSQDEIRLSSFRGMG
jgi:hypothetical protein